MTAQLEARAFAIWRHATIQDWDCSYAEIADATGLTYNQVRDTISRKKWHGRIGQGRGGGRRQWDENNLDLCQLIEGN